MWKTTPVCRDWSKCSRWVATMSNRSSVQHAQPVVLEVVGRDEVPWSPLGGEVLAAAAVVLPSVRNCRVRKGWGGPALAEVQLDGVRRPGARLVPDDDEVHREPADHAEPREVTSDHHGGFGDRRGVLDVRGEHAAEVALAAGATERLVVRGQRSTCPSGRARIWTLGLVRAVPVIRSSTMPPFAANAAR